MVNMSRPAAAEVELCNGAECVFVHSESRELAGGGTSSWRKKC